MEKEYLVDWDVWNAQSQSYEAESMCDWVYTDSEEDAIDLMMDIIVDYRDDWDVERDGDVLKLHHERYDRHEDRTIVKDLEYRNFRIHATE